MARALAAVGVFCCATLLWGTGCYGTDHPLFIDNHRVVPPVPTGVDTGPQPERDAGEPPVEIMDAAVHLPDSGPVLGPELNPDVSFQWTETVPGKGTCRAGLYIGKFNCEPPEDAGTVDRIGPLSGQVVFTLEGSSEAQLLTISEGTLFDDLFGVIYVNMVPMNGTLLCVDRHFEAVTVDDWSSLGLGMFKVELSGSLDDQELVIEGDFVLQGHLDPGREGGRCEGTFEVNAAP